MREGTIYEVVERKPIDLQTGVLSDQRIQVKYKNKRVPRTVNLRLVKYRDLATGISYHFLTNMMDEKPETIALLYKNRWTIELFFKRIKQNFELRYFLSDSENGIKSQIWVALIANLVFTVFERMTKRAEDFSTMVSMAAKNLCSFINFYHFISNMEVYRKAWVKRTFNLGNVQQINFGQPRGT
jgi:IS4 transposase